MQLAAWHESRYWLAAGWTMFHFLWIGTIVWIAAAALRSTLRRAGPRVRYAAAVLSMLATAAVPAGLFVAALDDRYEVTTQDLIHEGASFERPHAANAAPPVPTSETAQRPVRPAAIVRGSAVRPGPLPFAWGTTLTGGVKSLQNLASHWLPWLWMAGTPVLLLVMGCGVTGAERLRRAGTLLEEGDALAACRRLQGALRIGRRVAVAVCERIRSPLLVGIVRPVVLLPPAVLAGCSPEQIEMVLLHELAHVRRWDNLVNLVQRVIEAALYFHPVIWWLSNWVRLEREECCDRVVLAHTASPQAYAETLAALALPGIAPRHAAAAMADRHLVTRIRHILNLEDETMSVSRRVFIAAAGLVISCGCFAGSFAQPADDAAAAAAEAPPADAAVIAQELAAERLVQSKSVVLEATPAEEAVFHVGLEAFELISPQAIPDVAQVLFLKSKYSQLAPAAAGSMRNWGPEQATGAPDTPGHPAQGTAWCSATADGQEEWLELTYGEPVEPVALVVYENLKPGALTRVVAYDVEGNELNAWSGKDPSPPDSGNGSAISVVPLKLKKIKIVRVRLYLDSPHVEGWNEIDAVGLLGVNGAMHWATAATASSMWVGDATETARLERWLTNEPWEGSISVQDLSPRIGVNLARFKMRGVVQPNSADPLVAAQEPAVKPDRVAQFEERIKKLETELAGLREALQKFKSDE